LGCDSLADKPFGVLSQGERQQVLIARARMSRPLLLVLDEPCAGMDPGVRERFLHWLNERISHF
jgi:iron complex transport system ATP-binding protein